MATLHIAVPRPAPAALDDAYFPLLGYHIGKIATNEIPVITGLEGLTPTHDDLKAFGAAFATTSAAPMFHIAGITPEAVTVEAATAGIAPERHVAVAGDDLMATWQEMNRRLEAGVDLVSLRQSALLADRIATFWPNTAGGDVSLTGGAESHLRPRGLQQAGPLVGLRPYTFRRRVHQRRLLVLYRRTSGGASRSDDRHQLRQIRPLRPRRHRPDFPLRQPYPLRYRRMHRPHRHRVSPHGSRPLDLRRQRWANALAVALAPHMPWAPSPGGWRRSKGTRRVSRRSTGRGPLGGGRGVGSGRQRRR